MSTSRLARDTLGEPIQALAPDPANVAKVAIGAASNRVALPAGAEVVRVANNVSCYFKFGDVTVVATANDSLSPIGVDLFKVPTGATYLAVIQDGAVTGSVTITSMV